MYYDSESGRYFSNIDDAREVAGEKGFEVIEYKKVASTDDHEQCIEGLKWLVSQGIDAFFQPAISCFDWNRCDVKGIYEFYYDECWM